MIGILPTLAEGHLSPSTLSANPRYRLLSEQILAARGEDITIDIAGPERLRDHRRLDRPRGGLHQHPVPRADLARPVRGVLERLPGDRGDPARAWAPTRPTCSARSCGARPGSRCSSRPTDTRSEELKAQGVRPRVWFGERWITSVFDLFEENVRYFPALLPITDDEDPLEVLEAGGTPQLSRAAAAQRHDLPLEPAGLRHRRRRAAPAGREPGARAPGRPSPT